jgi:glyoxylase-like metal-dependent hydrolase (beta-lactamase superfamily II)
VLSLPFPELPKVNAYLLRDTAESALVDSGIHDPHGARGGSWTELTVALDACGATPTEIGDLLVTHPHVDHYGMAARMVAESGCALAMHEQADADLELYKDPAGRAARERALLMQSGVEPSELDELEAGEDWNVYISGLVEPARRLSEHDSVTLGGRAWEAIHTPGHARSHVCLWRESDGVLLSGDHLLGAVTPHIDLPLGREDPLGDYLDSLERIEKLEPRLVLPGHGRPFDNGAERARATLRHHERRLGAIVQVVRRAPKTVAEVSDEIFGSALLNLHRRLALGESLAHLVYLERRGEVRRITEDGGAVRFVKGARAGAGDGEA